jgi:hypothetical protein
MGITKDENGKIIINKMLKNKPDLKKLMSSRNYMLKSIIEKIYTKK